MVGRYRAGAFTRLAARVQKCRASPAGCRTAVFPHRRHPV